MAQVPYSPVPTVAPSGMATPKGGVDAPLAAFGGATGAALSKLGQTAEHAGDELFTRAVAMQQLNNEAEAKEADAQYMIEAGKLHADYSTLEGKAAVDAYPAFSKNLNDLRQKMKDGLSNDMAKRMFDASALSTMGRTIFNGAGHAATENKRYVNDASSARVAAQSDFVMQNPYDEGAFKRGNQVIEAEVRRTQADLGGWSPEKTQQEVTKHRSKLLALRVEEMAKTQPWTAKQYFDQNRSVMTAQDIERTDRLVESSTRTAGARVIADKTDTHFGTDANGLVGSLQERLTYAESIADKEAPDDPLMKDFVRQRVIANFNQSKSAKRDFDLDNINTVNGAIVGATTPNGKIPTTLEELTADPKVKTAWDNLDQTRQRGFYSALAKNAKGDQAWTRESQTRFLQLKGLAQADPLEFLGVDFNNENIPFSAKRDLVGQQLRMKDKAEGDPRVTHALQVLRPMTQAAGIDSSKDKDQYYQFVGALQDAMDLYQKDNKKLPTVEDINLMGAHLLQQSHSNMFTLPWSKDYMFALPVPEGVSNRIKNDPFWHDRGVTPTDADIQRIYTREQYQRLYGGAKKTEGK